MLRALINKLVLAFRFHCQGHTYSQRLLGIYYTARRARGETEDMIVINIYYIYIYKYYKV